MNEMRSFLSQDQRYTILPTPLPENEYSALDDMYFPETSMQDQVSIIDACLHNNYDVPRAKEIFERIRSDPRMTSHMTTRLYDAMLTGYNEMALRDPDMSDMWIEDALALYETMEDGGAQIAPSANTYANMLLLWLRVENQMMGPLSAMTTLVKPVTLLRRIVDREIPVSLVISNKAFTLSEDAAQAIKVLSRAAVDANLPNLSKVIMELGTVETLGTQLEDGSEALPEVMPVMKTKVRSHVFAHPARSSQFSSLRSNMLLTVVSPMWKSAVPQSCHRPRSRSTSPSCANTSRMSSSPGVCSLATTSRARNC